jgi:GNAT superfamily N-acetyltransferase
VRPPADVFDALSRCFLALTREVAGPGIESGSRPGLTYGALGLGVPDINRVMVAGAEGVIGDDTIDDVMGVVGGYEGISWWIPPGPGRAGLEARLGERGFRVSDDHDGPPGMWLELDEASLPAATPGLTIDLAASVEEIHVGCLVAAEGFGMPPAMGERLAEIFASFGDLPLRSGRLFVARLDGRPVATAVGALDGEALGIYSVATIPDARGRGIGGAVTMAAIADGRARGARFAVLESSGMGYPVYRRLGFQDAGLFRVLTRSEA